MSLGGMLQERSSLVSLQILSGFNPWNKQGLHDHLKRALSTEEYTFIESFLTSTYLKYVRLMHPPVPIWTFGRSRVFNVIPLTLTSQRSDVGYKSHLFPTELEHEILLMTENTEVNNIVVIVKTPKDFLADESTWVTPNSEHHIVDTTNTSLLKIASNQEKVNAQLDDVKLTGKYEIKYGAYSNVASVSNAYIDASFNPPDALLASRKQQDHKDVTFSRVISSLKKWLHDMAGRKVSVVSTAWKKGVDFAISFGKESLYPIHFVSLEATMSQMSSMSIDNEKMFDRMKNSFTEKINIEVSRVPHETCVFELQELNQSKQSTSVNPMSYKLVPVVSTNVEESIMIEDLLPPNIYLQDLTIVDGPRLISITASEVKFSVETSGYGFVTCELYEVPSMLTFSDVQRILETEGSQLQRLAYLQKRCVANLLESFSFSNLTAYCSYCVIVTLDKSKFAEDIDMASNTVFNPNAQYGLCHFRTLEQVDTKVSTTLMLSISPMDYSLPSESIRRVRTILDGFRSKLATPVYLMHEDTSTWKCDQDNLAGYKPLVSEEVACLHQMSTVSHCGLKPNAISSRPLLGHWKSLELSYSGRFCRLSLDQNNIESLKSINESLDHVLMLPLENISIYSAKPLIHYMFREASDPWKRWHYGEHIDTAVYTPLLCHIINRLLDWKRNTVNADCQIISVIDIAHPYMAYINDVDSADRFNGIRHLLLPSCIGRVTNDEKYCFTFQDSKLGDSLSYKIYKCGFDSLSIEESGCQSIQIFLPQFILDSNYKIKNPDAYKMEKASKVVYKMTCFISTPIKEVVGDDEDEDAPVIKSSEPLRCLHHIVIKMITNDLDNLEILVGPVIGRVTETSGIILFELNRDFDDVLCVLSPVGQASPNVTQRLSSKAYTPMLYSFNNLVQGQVYEIMLPEIVGSNRCLGTLRTLSQDGYFTELAFVGDEHLENFPVAEIIISDLNKQQSISFGNLQAEAMMLRYKRELRSGSQSQAVAESHTRPWSALSTKMTALSSTTSAVFHLGSHALLSTLIGRLAGSLIAVVKKYNLDDQSIVNKSALSKYYQIQLDQNIEDTLRLIWMIEPAIKEVMMSCSNLFMYNSDYWISELTLQKYAGITLSDSRDISALQVIRTAFDKYLQLYVHGLKEWQPDSENHFNIWRSKTMAVVSLDFSYERLVLAEYGEKKDINQRYDVGEEKSVFSKTFMTIYQWKQLRKVLADSTIMQLVICSQFPVISLEEVNGSTKLREWVPAADDINAFFSQLIKWINISKKTKCSRHVCLVSSDHMSYTTCIEDIRSGAKIQQLCIGKFAANHNARSNSSNPEYIRSGKLSQIRYVHHVVGQDSVLIDSTFNGNGGKFAASVQKGISPMISRNGEFGILRFWFDSWQPIGNWMISVVSASGGEVIRGDAVIITGPIIGAPVVITSEDGTSSMMATVLIEVDRNTSITLCCTDVITLKATSVTKTFLPKIPSVLTVGPLNLHTRYNCVFTSGVQNSYLYNFVIHTSMSKEESNAAIINCESYGTSDESWNSSDAIKEIYGRLRVPFNGINLTLHLNIGLYVDMILNEAKLYKGINNLIESDRKNKKMSFELNKFISLVLERIRGEYRTFFSRPSYKQLMNNGFNLFMLRSSLEVSDDALPPEGSLESLLSLIVNRAQQEYFNQFKAAANNVYSASPRVKLSSLADDMQEELVIPEQSTEVRLIYQAETNDDDILRIPQKRRPKLMYFDYDSKPSEMIFQQWMKNLVPPPPLWTNYLTPNKSLIIEDFCFPLDKNIREIRDRILGSEYDSGNRIIVLPDIGSLFNQDAYVGYKIQCWIREWIGERSDRTLALLCPSRYDEGTRLVAMNYINGSEQLIIQMLSTVYRSNAAVIAQIKLEQKAYLKDMKEKAAANKSRATISRAAQQKQIDEDNARKVLMERTLEEKLQSLTPDGFLIAECRSITSKQDDKDVTLRLMKLEVFGSPATISGEHDENRPGLFDYIELPLWWTRFTPGTSAVFIQDEVNLIIRQEPNSKKILEIIEKDEEFQNAIRRTYEASRLSELSRPSDLQETDLSIPGVIEICLEEVFVEIWNSNLPEAMKARLLPLWDKFIRSYCIARTLRSDKMLYLSSSDMFLKLVLHTLLSSAQLFLALKMSAMTRWKHILDLPEFPEDFDRVIAESDESDEEKTQGEEEEEVKMDADKNADNLEEPIKEASEATGKDAVVDSPVTDVVQASQEPQIIPPLSLKEEVTVETLRTELYEKMYKRIVKRRAYGDLLTFMSGPSV